MSAPIASIKTFYKLTVSKDAAAEDFYVTGEHPFWLPDKAVWRTAGELNVGDALLNYAGQRLHVSAKLALSEKRQTYNITVEGTGTYFVGRNEVLVHNTNCSTGVQIKDATGQMAAEFDKVIIEAEASASKLVENKSGWGLRGASEAEMEQWAAQKIRLLPLAPVSRTTRYIL